MMFNNDEFYGLEKLIEVRQDFIRSHYDPLWCSWFSGLVDGEGYFHLVRRSNGRFETEFVINLRRDDIGVLAEIHATLGIGRLYSRINDSKQRNQGIQASDRTRWRCYRIAELITVLVPLFEEYPLHSKKNRDYGIWKKAAFLKYQGAHRYLDGREILAGLVEELKVARKDTPFWEDLNDNMFYRNRKARDRFKMTIDYREARKRTLEPK